jgi:hypothetical protein
MIEIEITGLTKRQKILADILWHIEDWNQVEVFMKSLPERDRIDCEGIIEMMRMSLVEQYAAAMKADGLIEDEYEQAKELIDKVKGL